METIKNPANPISIREPAREDFSGIEAFLSESNDLYPGIQQWWEHKVKPELMVGRRIVLVVGSGGDIDGLFIGKPGKHAKLCTLRLRRKVRGQRMGTALVTEGLRRLLQQETRNIRVTISEAAEARCIPFFESFGFRRTAIETNRYVRGVDELVYSCPARELSTFLQENYSHLVEETLFGVHPHQNHQDHTLLMSLRPEFAELFLQGNKSVEFRRRFSRKHVGSTVIFYVSSPICRFVFSAVVSNVKHMCTKDLWSAYKCRAGITRAKFDEYFRGVNYGFSLLVENPTRLPRELSLEQVRRILPHIRPPQSFKRLDHDSPLVELLGLLNRGTQRERGNTFQKTSQG